MNRALVTVGLVIFSMGFAQAQDVAPDRTLPFRVPHAYRDKFEPTEWGPKVVVNPYVFPAWPLESSPAPATAPGMVRLPTQRSDLR
jgi:hypothetical protein